MQKTSKAKTKNLLKWDAVDMPPVEAPGIHISHGILDAQGVTRKLTSQDIIRAIREEHR